MNQFRSEEKEKRGSDSRDREAAGANLGGIVATLSILVMFTATAMVATAQQPPTPFYIYGWVFDASQPLNNPNVMIGVYHHMVETAETNATSNYYQLIISSYNVSTGSILMFKVRDDITGNCTPVLDDVVPQDYMDRGGMFEQNFTVGISLYPWWDGCGPWCGDVDCNCEVDMGDYVTMVNSTTMSHIIDLSSGMANQSIHHGHYGLPIWTAMAR